MAASSASLPWCRAAGWDGLATHFKEGLVIAAYSDHRGIQQLIEGHFPGPARQTAADLGELRRMMTEARVSIVGTLECSTRLVRHLKAVFRLDWASGPTCIVVTRVTYDNLRSLRDVRGDRLHVVWIEEVEETLPKVLETVAPDNPLRAWGIRLLNARSPSLSIARAVRLVCGISPGPPAPPASSVIELVKRARIDPKELSYRWRAEMPLGCTLKQLLSWGVLRWAIRHRNDGTWKEVARAAGIDQQTLRRYSLTLARCSLADAADDPARVARRLDEWLSGVTIR